MEKAADIDFENDNRPPSVLQRIILDPKDTPPFSDVPELPRVYEGKSLVGWYDDIDTLYFEDKPRYCVLLYAFANGGSFSMDMVPKSFRLKDLPREMEESEWIRSYKYTSKVVGLDRNQQEHSLIEEAAISLTKPDEKGRGPYLSVSEYGVFSFPSPILCDAAYLSYCSRRHYRALSLAAPVLLYRYNFTYSQYKEMNYTSQKLARFLHPSDEDILFEIFVRELSKGHLFDTLANRMWMDTQFCESFVKYLNIEDKECEEQDIKKTICTTIDVTSTPDRPKSILYCLIAQKPPRKYLFDSFLVEMEKLCEKEFMQTQFVIVAEYCCRNALMDTFLIFVSKVKTFPFLFIRSAIIGGDSILLDRLLSHQTWNEAQLNKAMHWVALSGKFDEYLRLKLAGATLDGITLHESIMGKSFPIFEDIIQDGFDLDVEIYNDRKAIHAAAEVGSLEIIEYLLQRGVDVESKSLKGELPLLIAIDNSHEELAERLLMLGADVNQRDYRGSTAILRACAKGLYRLVERLMYVGADVTDTDKQGCNILHKAYIGGEQGVIDFVKSNGFEDDVVDVNKNTMLHFSALSGNVEQFEQLLNKMPLLISACNSFMWSPIFCAALCGRWKLFDFLKRNGANTQQRTGEGVGISELAKRGKQLRLLNVNAYIEEFQEFVTLGSVENYDKIITAMDSES